MRGLWTGTMLCMLAGVLGCRESAGIHDTDAEDTKAVYTDSASYTLRRVAGGFDAVAKVVYVNRSSKPEHFLRCDPRSTGPRYSLQRVNPDTGFFFVGGIWACVGGVPTGVLAPGDSMLLSVSLSSSDSPHAQPPITMGQRTGTFKIVVPLCKTPVAELKECPNGDYELRASNTFVLRPPTE